MVEIGLTPLSSAVFLFSIACLPFPRFPPILKWSCPLAFVFTEHLAILIGSTNPPSLGLESQLRGKLPFSKIYRNGPSFINGRGAGSGL